MPQPLGIKQIKSKLLSPALTSLYYVQVNLPSAGPLTPAYMKSSGVLLDQDRLNLMCCEASLPGSQLATLELNNDRTGVTEKHAHRKIFDDRIDLTFYVDAENYMPIRFFETWINFISQQSTADIEGRPKATDKDYFYSFEYPDDYMSDNGMKIVKFEKSSLGNAGISGILGTKPSKAGQLTYTFIRTFPLSISSMPVSYDQSSLLKCTVSMSYIRYVVDGSNPPIRPSSSSSASTSGPPDSPFNIPFADAANLDLKLGNNYFQNADPQFDFGPGAQASFNASQAFNAGLPAAAAGTNAFKPRQQVEAGLPYVGRNVGPIAPFSGL